jgi:hypothetical protein
VYPGVNIAIFAILINVKIMHRLVPSEYSKVCPATQTLVRPHLSKDLDSYWSNEFAMFYNPQTGLDIDGAWIDMNEPASVSISNADNHSSPTESV